MTAPLLMLAEGRRPRLRKAPVIRESELSFHMRVAGFLRKYARPDWLWAHYPNGEVRHAGKAAAMGARPGWPDWTLLSPTGSVFFIELKAHDGRLSEAQKGFREWCLSHGVAYVVASNVSEVLNALVQWGALTDDALTAAVGGGND
jgi:hypothetical protein